MIRPSEFKQSGYVLLLLICFTIIACSDKDIDRINDTSNAAEVNPESNTHESLIESDTGFDSNAETTISDEVIKTEFIEIDNIGDDSYSSEDGLFDEANAEIVVTMSESDVDYEPVYGGTLKFSTEYTNYEFSYENLHLQFSPTLSSFGPGVIYSRILKFKTGPKVIQPSLEIECDLCESWKMISPTRFEFRLKEEVKWHNTDSVTSEVLQSQHILDSIDLQLNGPNSILLGSISDISIINDLEFNIDLKIPDADFMLGLADARSRIINTEANTSVQSTRTGTGPWQIRNDGNRGVYKFEKNPVYFEENLPYADNLNLYIIPDEVTRQTAFVVGGLDAIHLNDSQLREFESQFEKRDYLHVPETGIGVEISLNTKRPPFEDITIRKAFYLASDPVSYINEIWPEAAYISLGIPLIHDEWLNSLEEQSKYFSDLEQAKRMLQGLELNPFTIKVGKFGVGYIDYAKRLEEDLIKVGFQPIIEEVSRVDYVDRVWKDADYDVFVGPAPYVYSPNIYLFSIVHSEGLWNHGNPLSKQLDLLIEQQSGEYDESKRLTQYREIQNLLWESYTRYMPATVKSTWLVNDWLQNFYPTLAGFEYNYLSETWLDMQP